MKLKYYNARKAIIMWFAAIAIGGGMLLFGAGFMLAYKWLKSQHENPQGLEQQGR